MLKYLEEAAVAKLTLNRSQMISSTDAARRFSEYLDRASKNGDRLYVTRNNEIEAVLIGIEDFERLLELEDLVEHLSIAKLIEERKDEPEVSVDLVALAREEGFDPDELRRSDPES